jgi:predicted MFS family arabinose efflux permease
MSIRRAALGTAAVFALSGALLGTWVSRLPATRDRLHASPAELGVVLLAMGLGSLTSMPVTGALCRRYGSRTMVAATAVLAAGVLGLLAVAPSVPWLAAGLFGYGALFGAWDVAMNVQGSTVDLTAGRAYMPRYHACWSAGAILGAAAGGLAARLGVPVSAHFPAVGLVGAVLVVLATRTFLPDRREAAGDGDEHHSWRRVLTARLLGIGLITMAATLVEGAAADWLPLFLVDGRHASAPVAAAGFAVFSVAMTAGRFAGTAIIERLGRHVAIGAGGLASIVGVTLTVLGPGVPAGYAGAVLWALGVCLVFPAAMSAAGENPVRPADAIAVVATFGYAGLLVGPPLIGPLAEHVGLGRALLVLPVLGAAITLLAPAARPVPVDDLAAQRAP